MQHYVMPQYGDVEHSFGLCRSTSELSGVGVESSLLRFVRQHVQAAVALPTGQGTSLFLQASGGALLPWGASWQSKPTCISDR